MTQRQKKTPRAEIVLPPSGRLPEETIELGDLAQHAGTYLRMFSRVMNSGVDELMAEHPIGPGQGKTSALQVIVLNPGISQSELSDIFGRDRSAQFRIIQELERRGFVYRRTDPGQRRRHMLFATDAGTALVAELEAIARENDAKVFAALTPKEYLTFRRLLVTLWKSTLGESQRYWPDFKG